MSVMVAFCGKLNLQFGSLYNLMSRKGYLVEKGHLLHPFEALRFLLRPL